MLRLSTLLVASAFAVAPVQAIASPQDIVATHTYIQANYALAKSGVARIGVAQAAIGRLNTKLAQQCPGEGAGSIEDEASQPVSYEVAAALWSTAYGGDAGPIGTFVETTRRLRWSNQRITRLAQSYASNLHKLATLALPDLCKDVGSWKASGFQIVPATTTRADARVQSLELEPIPPRLLVQFERGADASVLARTRPLELKLEGFEFSLGQSDWYEVLETLGLKP